MKRALVACLALGGAIAALAVALVFATAPSPAGLHARFNAQLRATGAEPVDLSSVAPPLRDAVVATEDERFYQHQGVDLIGVLRAIPYDIRHLAFRQGASTITEQLAKVLYFGGHDHAPWRKAQVAALAVRLEARYSKEEILGDYLNAVYFGAGAWGIAKASETYRFGRLSWPRFGRLIWPHPRPIACRAFGLFGARAGGRRGDGIEGGAVRADPA